MKKQNIINFKKYQAHLKTHEPPKNVQNELERAIQQLIHRLRYLGPIK